MKYTKLAVLSGAAFCHASIFQLPGLPASLSQSFSTIVAMLGIDMNDLGHLDLARFGPFIKPLMPIANSMADNGALIKYVNSVGTTLPLNNKTSLEPILRKTTKRVKARWGPYKLNGQGVSIICVLTGRSKYD
jgi:hypothetical protein